MKNVMKKFWAVLTTSALLNTTAFALDLDGQWQGNLEVGQQSVPIIFNISETGDSISATMDSPMQGATDIPVKSVDINGSDVVFDIAVAAARYEAKYAEGKLVGTWRQSGQSFSLSMTKGEVAQVKKN